MEDGEEEGEEKDMTGKKNSLKIPF